VHGRLRGGQPMLTLTICCLNVPECPHPHLRRTEMDYRRFRRATAVLGPNSCCFFFSYRCGSTLLTCKALVDKSAAPFSNALLVSCIFSATTVFVLPVAHANTMRALWAKACAVLRPSPIAPKSRVPRRSTSTQQSGVLYASHFSSLSMNARCSINFSGQDTSLAG
jgi:hypothetical protein